MQIVAVGLYPIYFMPNFFNSRIPNILTKWATFVPTKCSVRPRFQITRGLKGKLIKFNKSVFYKFNLILKYDSGCLKSNLQLSS